MIQGDLGRICVIARARTLRASEAETVYQAGKFRTVRQGKLAQPCIGRRALRNVSMGEQDHVALVAARGLRDTNYILRVAAGPLELGVAIGLITALALTRLLGSQLWHMSPLDPMTFAA